MTLYSPFNPTSGDIIPPNINWNKPSKLDALPLPPVLDSIAKVKLKGPIPVTGQTFKKKAMTNTQRGKWNISVKQIRITPAI